MFTLDPRKLAQMPIPLGTGWLMGDCMEACGKQELWIRQKPETLEVLREQAIVQSVESSNRIEGVTVAANRLRPVVIGRSKPKDRPEEELAGYRAALDWIFSRKNRLTLTPELICKLHALAQGGTTGDAGEFKKRDNEIIEILPNGERSVRFVAVPAKKTPLAMENLCRRYRDACEDGKVPPLLLVGTFILDLLCVHPFRDGNGRVSRLVTSLLLESHGFRVARYISLERHVEERKEEYYGALKLCSHGWHEGKNEIVPWWNYFLGVLRSAYKEFAHRIEAAEKGAPKSDLVRHTLLTQVEPFTLAEMSAQLPAASPQLIKKVLAELKQAHRVRLEGRGRGARWETIRR
jgi:Fic family protein